MNFGKYIRNINKNECIICFDKPKKISKCLKCNNAFCCVKCIDNLYEIDENIICECCKTDKKYDTRLFLKIKCPLCRYYDIDILNSTNLNKFSKSKISQMLIEYNKKTIDRFNFEFRVNRNAEYDYHSINENDRFSDTSSNTESNLMLEELNENGLPIYERNDDNEIVNIEY